LIIILNYDQRFIYLAQFATAECRCHNVPHMSPVITFEHCQHLTDRVVVNVGNLKERIQEQRDVVMHPQ